LLRVTDYFQVSTQKKICESCVICGLKNAALKRDRDYSTPKFL